MNFSRLSLAAILSILVLTLGFRTPNALAQAIAQAVPAEITGKLTTKTAKVGDTITAKTSAKAKLKDGTELPKGTKLVARVTAVQSLQDGAGTSSLALKFEQAQLKSGTVEVHAAIVALAPAPVAQGDLPTGNSIRNQPLSTLDKYGHSDSDGGIPLGSSIEGIGMGESVGSDGTSHFRGKNREIKLDSGDLIKVAFL